MLLNSRFVVLANDFSTYSEESVDSGLAIENLQESLISVSEEMTISSSENSIESETNSSDSVVENSSSSMDGEINLSSGIEIELSEEIVEEIQYESIFYNNQWFQVPVQPETKELTINPNDNHELGSFVVGETNSRAKLDVITEKQTGRPRWDFIDVASYQSDLSVSDYEYMKKQGITGVVVKLTEATTYKNPYAKTQIENAKKAGLKVSTYHFSRYTTKSGAEKEAEFYAKVAKELKLSSDTIMVNDLEVGLNQYSTQNSMIFSNRLKSLGYNNTIHYSSAYMFSSGLLSTAMLGEKNLWVAQYPYQPSNKDILHSTRSAWQWSSTMQFTTIKGKTFDVNMDHSGLFSNFSIDKPKDEILNSISSEKIINKYGTIGNTDYIFWLDLNLQQENVNSSKYYNKTLFVEKEFTFRDGKKLFSIKNNENNFIGYIESAAVTIAGGQHGIYQNYGKYVMLKGDYAIWNGFNWAKSTSAAPYKNKTVQARGIYYHFNGSSYLSLYDNQGKWVGYINQNGTKAGSSQQEKFKKVQDLLNKEFKNQNLGIYVMSLVDGSTAQINGNKQFHAASTGKLPALYYTQKMILEKKVDGNKLLTYTDAINQMSGAYMRGGAGVLQSQPYGKKFSLNTIMNWTAKYSDNQGTNFLAYYASNKYDAAMKKEISTIMGRNWTAPFYVNAKDNAMMLEAIYNQGGKLITDMSNTVYDNQRIPKYIPVQVAHKIGDVNDLRHDAGIIYSKEPYVLSVLTQNYQSYEKISVLSKKIYDILK